MAGYQDYSGAVDSTGVPRKVCKIGTCPTNFLLVFYYLVNHVIPSI
jgi:hypothetical protein